jgi:hypothetical protein
MLKCLALMQPWASLIVHGFKRYETRSWNPKHRGPLLIHASRRFNPAARNLATQQPFLACLQEAGYKSVNDLPIGAIVGIVNLVDVAPVEIVAPALDTTERQFGDYSPGRYASLLAGATPIKPIQVGGRLGIYNCPKDAMEQIREVSPTWSERVETHHKSNARMDAHTPVQCCSIPQNVDQQISRTPRLRVSAPLAVSRRRLQCPDHSTTSPPGTRSWNSTPRKRASAPAPTRCLASAVHCESCTSLATRHAVVAAQAATGAAIHPC